MQKDPGPLMSSLSGKPSRRGSPWWWTTGPCRSEGLIAGENRSLPAATDQPPSQSPVIGSRQRHALQNDRVPDKSRTRWPRRRQRLAMARSPYQGPAAQEKLYLNKRSQRAQLYRHRDTAPRSATCPAGGDRRPTEATVPLRRDRHGQELLARAIHRSARASPRPS